MNKECYHLLWNRIHLRSKWANESKKNFDIWCAEIRWDSENFPCSECGKHFKEYIRKNPPEDSTDAFFYTWAFHNSVNIRLGKKVFSLDEARKLFFTDNGIKCSEGCAEGGKNPSHVHKELKVDRSKIFK